jgi:hypothetical protein
MDEDILPREYRLTECETTNAIDRIAGWARQELDLLLLKRTAIAKRITMIQSTLAGLAAVFGSDVIAEQRPAPLSKPPVRHTLHRSRGLTQACRQTLTSSQHPLTTAEIYRRIQKTNPEIMARHNHPKVALAVVLRRLVTYGEVCDGIDEQDSRTWLWIDGNSPSESASVHSSSALKQEGFASLDI